VLVMNLLRSHASDIVGGLIPRLRGAVR